MPRHQDHGQAPAYMIDSPSPYEMTATWESFLETLESLPQGDLAVAAEIRNAKRLIAEKKAPMKDSHT